jgi:hypothetical protein
MQQLLKVLCVWHWDPSQLHTYIGWGEQGECGNLPHEQQ